MRILSGQAQDAAWHLFDRCEWCEFFDHCREEMRQCDDVSRLVQLTTYGKRHLREEAGVQTLTRARPVPRPVPTPMRSSTAAPRWRGSGTGCKNMSRPWPATRRNCTAPPRRTCRAARTSPCSSPCSASRSARRSIWPASTSASATTCGQSCCLPAVAGKLLGPTGQNAAGHLAGRTARGRGRRCGAASSNCSTISFGASTITTSIIRNGATS